MTELEISALEYTVAFIRDVNHGESAGSILESYIKEIERLNLELLKEKRNHIESIEVYKKQLERSEKRHAERITADLRAQHELVNAYEDKVSELKINVEMLKRQIK